jgi:hypothetical protein
MWHHRDNYNPRRCTALNAVILARLSDLEPMEAVARVIEHCIQAQRIVLTADNADQHFVRGVCHCILQVCDGGRLFLSILEYIYEHSEIALQYVEYISAGTY